MCAALQSLTSFIYVIFEDGTDNYWARSCVWRSVVGDWPQFAFASRSKYLNWFQGWVAERLKAPVLKTGRPARVS